MSSTPRINLPFLRERCKVLRDLLQSYSVTEPEAELCLRELSPIFVRALAGKIVQPLKTQPPCAYYFHEGSLGKYRSLEEAFSSFSMAIQGYDSAATRALFERYLPRRE